MAQGLRFSLPVQGMQAQSLVRELRSHLLCGMAKKIFFKHAMSLCQYAYVIAYVNRLC